MNIRLLSGTGGLFQQPDLKKLCRKCVKDTVCRSVTNHMSDIVKCVYTGVARPITACIII